MSGQVGNNILRTSGVVAATAAGLNWVSTVVTASTLTAEAGNGYFINTTSNTCTITLPSSAEAGDQIVLMDYLRTWGTNKIIIDSNGLNYQGEADTYTVEYNTDGETVNIVYADATKGWIPLNDDDVTEAPVAPPTQKGIFAFGFTSAPVSMSNLVNSSGVIASDVTGVGSARNETAAANYGGDKAIYGYGNTGSVSSLTNLVNNSGVVAADVTGVGTARNGLAAAGYGTDKAIFAYGGSDASMSNLVSNSGVVATDTAGVGTGRRLVAGAGYGSTGQAIFGYGTYSGTGVTSLTNLVSNLGVVASDTSGVGAGRQSRGAAMYGGDKALFGFGFAPSANTAITNLVSNLGVVASDTAAVGGVTARDQCKATAYGGDKAIFAYGNTSASAPLSMSNLISSSGVVASDVTGVGTARYEASGAGFSFSA